MLKREKLKFVLHGLLGLALVCRAFGQGRVAFNNYAANLSPVTISSMPGTFNPADGPPSAYVGSDYTASLFYVLGSVTDQTVFDSSNPTWITTVDARFLGTTGIGPGHGWGGDGSGFFDGGIASFNFALTTATFQVRAWHNGGGLYTSYEQAVSAGHNAGQSNLLPLFVDAPPGPVTVLSGLQPFTVGIPEPSTFVLAVLGGGLLLLVCRRRGLVESLCHGFLRFQRNDFHRGIRYRALIEWLHADSAQSNPARPHENEDSIPRQRLIRPTTGAFGQFRNSPHSKA